MLIEPDFMKRLENLRISSKKLFPGAMKGKRRSVKRGNSIEFADYRDYQPGDDFRFIDWNIYSRLDRLFLKTFVEEENIYIHILIDISTSMGFGDLSKLEYAKRIAAALSYIGLVDLDIVAVTAFAERLNSLRPIRGKGHIFTLIDFLEKIDFPEAGSLSLIDYCLKRYSYMTAHPGVAIIISDFLVPQNVYEEGLRSLIYKNFDLNVIHIMAHDEINPAISGELKLKDSETNETKEITITDRMLERYQAKLKSFCENLVSFCAKNNITYIGVNTGFPFEELILKTLRSKQVLY